MDIATAPAAPLAMMLRVNEQLLGRALDGLSDEQLWYRPTANNNPLLWLAGHVAQSRAGMLNQLGAQFDTGWGTVFRRGSSVGDAVTYAPRGEILSTFTRINALLYDSLESVELATLNKPATGPVRTVTNVLELLTFLTAHDSYHVGQMAYIRKSLGLPGLIG